MSKCVAGLRGFCLAGCFLAILFATPFLNAQNTIHVPGDQPTIQAGINAANNGDTVLVAPGKYVENINFNGKAITLTSSGGPSVTTIDGGANGSVVTFNTGETNQSILSSFTIQNGSNYYGAGGIQISNASPKITGNVITGNRATGGNGIYINGGSPLITANIVTGNTQIGSGGGGGGIYATAGSGTPSSPTITGNTITNNSVANGGNGGGIAVDYFSSPLIENNLIQGNTAYNNGGGISIDSYNSLSVPQNVIVNNSVLGSYSGGGLWVSASNSPELFVNNTIAGNTAPNHTSGVYVTGFGQNATFTNNLIVATAGQSAVTCDSSYSSISPVLSYNDAFSSSGQNWSGICNTTGNPGNISADPLFINAAADFHLQWGSPAVDAGNNSAPNLPATDFDGNTRIVDGNRDGIAVVDLGAYELSPTTITLAPNNLIFGAQPLGTTSAPQLVTLTNTGNQPLRFVISVDANFSQTNNCVSPLAAATSCTINVSFSPATAGNITGNLTLRDTATNNPHTVALAGTGGAPAASLAPSSLTFGPQLVGTTSAAQTVTLSNTGSDAMAIAGIASSGGEFVQTNNCGTTLAAGSSCSINVTFTPAATGSRPGLITVTDNASGSPQSIPLTGTGTALIASLSPASLTFGGQQIGTTSAAQSATLSNSGSAPLSISAITVSGDFAQTNNCGSTLATGSSCSISVTFTPTTMGTRSGSLTVTDNASGSPQSTSLTGTGTAPIASLSPSSLAFGAQVIGTTSAAQSATLSNTGSAPLSISAITITGAFSQTNNCGNSLAPGTSCAVNVTFAPTAQGSYAGSLTVTDNASGSPQTTNLSGTGVDFSISASPNNPSAARGNSVNVTVSVNSLGGPFGNSVGLSCSRLPSGAACSFSPANVVPGNSGGTSIMTVTTNRSSTPVGTFVVTISGQSGALSHSTQIHLTVTKH